MLEPRHNERPGDWLNSFAIKRFPYIEAFFVCHIEVFGPGSALWKKRRKIGVGEKKKKKKSGSEASR